MSEDQKPESREDQEPKARPETHEDSGATFDMYHFFSRKDVIFIAALIIALLIYFVSKFMLGHNAA